MAEIAIASIAAGSSIAGGVMSFLGQKSAGKAQRTANIIEAQQIIENADAQISFNKQAMEELIASQIARGGGNVSGSVSAIVGDTAFKTTFENELIKRSARVRANVLISTGQQIKQGADIRAAGTLITAGVSTATSLSKIVKLAKQKTNTLSVKKEP